MGWSIEEHIGDCRPFPEQVIVYRGETDECLAYVSGEVADRLKAENERLREQLAKARDPQRIGGRADPESFVYAIEQLREFRWQHATNDEDAIPYINNVAAAHERENEQLREQMDTAEHNRKRNFREYVRMCHENDKLRELLRDTLIQTDQYCDKYGIEYEDIADALYKANADLNRRLHELGVEVNE